MNICHIGDVVTPVNSELRVLLSMSFVKEKYGIVIYCIGKYHLCRINSIIGSKDLCQTYSRAKEID